MGTGKRRLIGGIAEGCVTRYAGLRFEENNNNNNKKRHILFFYHNNTLRKLAHAIYRNFLSFKNGKFSAEKV